jgi:hypothetical protein
VLITDRWRDPENVWRQALFSIDRLPTVVKVDGENVSDLVVKWNESLLLTYC